MEDLGDRGELDAALRKLRQEVIDGVGHGFFHYTVSCEIVNGRTRRMIITAGKSHRFNIPEEELDT